MSGSQVSQGVVLLLLVCAWALPEEEYISQVVVGGEPSLMKDFPMMAAIGYREMHEVKCGAIVITQQHVVTAGHCVFRRATSNTSIIVGTSYYSNGWKRGQPKFVFPEDYEEQPGSASLRSRSGRANEPDPQAFLAESFTVHPDYSSVHYKNDIAVVRVWGTIIFNMFVSPVCLPFDYVDFNLAGSKVEMCGYGHLYPGGPKSANLFKVTVDCISQAQCQAYVPSLVDSQLCTLTPGKDACQGDSGGPVLYTEPGTGRVVLVGIISHGKSCASGDPGINTRVASYLDWILSIAPVDYCRD